MCSRVVCNMCKKYTWSGCGQHIDEALAGIPNDQICTGHVSEAKDSGIFGRIFGRSNT